MKVVSTERLPIKMWLDDLEEGALAQAKDIANLPFAYKWVAIMPDSHQGYGMPIGGVMATNHVVVPNAVGVDIGCGMVAVKTDLTTYDMGDKEKKTWMELVRNVVPTGFSHQQSSQEWEGFDYAPDLYIIQDQLERSRKQLGTLGGGNHFIELQRDFDGSVWVMIHSGSRNFGKRTADFYHDIAKTQCERWASDIPNKDLSFLPMEDRKGMDYLEAMGFALGFAKANRALMMNNVCRVLNDVVGGGVSFEEIANIHHNYAALENHYGKNVLVHRKGATKASEGAIGIVPGSMGSSSYITRGLGNKESFNSSAHGAGRAMGRGVARRTLDLAEEQAKMEGILGKPRNEQALDEAPGAYKDINTVMENQRDLVEVVEELRPLASIKG